MKPRRTDNKLTSRNDSLVAALQDREKAKANGRQTSRDDSLVAGQREGSQGERMTDQRVAMTRWLQDRERGQRRTDDKPTSRDDSLVAGQREGKANRRPTNESQTLIYRDGADVALAEMRCTGGDTAWH